jgi:hypothetical protein
METAHVLLFAPVEPVNITRISQAAFHHRRAGSLICRLGHGPQAAEELVMVLSLAIGELAADSLIWNPIQNSSRT